MKVYGIAVFLSFFLSLSKAQEVVFQLAPGIINYGGDLQSKSFTFQQSHFSIAGTLGYSVSHLMLRGTATYGKVSADDKFSTYAKRNLNFSSTIIEANLALEYDVFTPEQKNFTPYVFAGFGMFHFSPYSYARNGSKVYLQPLGTEGQGLSIYPEKKKYALNQMNLPVGIGLKYHVADGFSVGIEFCSRLLFTDYLDDVSTDYPDETTLIKENGQRSANFSFRGYELDPSLPFPSGKQRGNPDRNDNYYTASITLSCGLLSLFAPGGTSKQSRCPPVY